MNIHSIYSPGSALTRARYLAAALLGITALSTATLAQGAAAPNFGPNVIIFDPSMTSTQIQTALTSISNEDQFSANRHAVFFKPGAYNIQAPVGYYESIAGLGEEPGSVTITGFLTPNFGTTTQYFPGTNVTDTFWRSLENMTVNPVQNTAQNAAPNTLQWGVSQAAPLRRLQINGDLELTDSYCGNASGGFMSDLVVTGNVNPCSQQQWFTRNSQLGSWNGGVWNMVFSGVLGAPTPSYPSPPETVVATTPLSREKPFLYVDVNGKYKVFQPAVRHNSTGTSWAAGAEAGRSLPISDFFIAFPSQSAMQINAALASGKNLILTPGVYHLDRPLDIARPDTIVLGLGFATLIPQNGSAAITVEDVPGVQIAGLLIDAGPVNSPALLAVGKTIKGVGTKADPVVINDLNLRVGGAELGKAATSLLVNQNDVVLDNIWAWRADHGAQPSYTGWTVNTGDHGLVVNGDNVLATGLAVEHYQKEQVLWNGNGGETIFYQSELPYDPPSQAAWTDGKANGYPSYVVAKNVTTHQAYGLGIYSFFNQGINIIEDNAITAPDLSGVIFEDAGTVFLNGMGQITAVINGQGGPVNSTFPDQLHNPIAVYP